MRLNIDSVYGEIFIMVFFRMWPKKCANQGIDNRRPNCEEELLSMDHCSLQTTQ